MLNPNDNSNNSINNQGVTLDGVGKRYGATWVLEHIDLAIADGEFFSLLGSSGSGKTTLLKSIAGIESPDRGRILFQGEDVAKLPMEQRPFNTVFQGYALFPHMSVFENVAFGLRVKRVSGMALKTRVNEMVERVGLWDRVKAYPRELSGGQQQRVAIARVLVCEPKVILLDEPLSALDASLRGQMQRFLKDLHRDLGLTFIFVTHDQNEAMSLSDRVCLLNNGRIEQVDTPDALYHAPATEYTARFIGLNNLIEVDSNGQTEFGIVSEAIDATLAIRPEVISLNGTEELGTNGVLIARQFHGDNTIMTFRTGTGREVIVRRLGRGEPLDIGNEARLTIAREACSIVRKGGSE